MDDSILSIPIFSRIKKALINIPLQYDIDQNSEILDCLKLNKGDTCFDFNNNIYTFPDINNVHAKSGECDPIWLVHTNIWHKYNKNKIGYLSFNLKGQLLILSSENQQIVNQLLVRSYGSYFGFRAPAGCVEISDINDTSTILSEDKYNNPHLERQATLLASIRETKEETGIDVTKIPNYMQKIKHNGIQFKKKTKIYIYHLELTIPEYQHYVIDILNNPTQELLDSIDPEISEIKYIQAHS